MRSIPFVLSAFLLAAPAAAPARDFSGPLSPGAFEATLNMGPIAQTLRQQMQAGAPAAAPQERAPSSGLGLRYVPSKERRAANVAGFVAKSRLTSPQAADNLQAVFAQQDIIESMRAPLAKLDLRIDDLADTYAVWWINAWQASRGISETPDPSTIAAVRAQAARALLASPAVRGANDAAKQQLAEALLIQAAVLDGIVEGARGKPEMMKAVRAAAAQGARGMGLDLASMTLTKTGFAPIR
jgi:hypothetical protein